MWIKLDDGIATHPKVLEAGILALGIQVRAICYCSKNFTDGFLSPMAIPLLLTGLDDIGLFCGMGGMDAKDFDWPAFMVEHGLWDEVEGGYQVHDYLDWNVSKKEYEKWKKRLSSNGKKGMKSRWNKEKLVITDVITPVITNDITSLSTATATLNPLPNGKGKSERKGGEIPLPAEWSPNENHYKLGQARKLDVALEAAHFRGRAKELDWVQKDWDLKFTNWMLQEIKFRQARKA